MKKKIFVLLALILSFSLIAPYANAAKSVSELKKQMQERETERKKAEKEINSKKEERDDRIAE